MPAIGIIGSSNDLLSELGDRLRRAGHIVHIHNTTYDGVEGLGQFPEQIVDDRYQNARMPCYFWIALPEQEATDALTEIDGALCIMDVVIDSSNASIERITARGSRFAKHGIYYVHVVIGEAHREMSAKGNMSSMSLVVPLLITVAGPGIIELSFKF